MDDEWRDQAECRHHDGRWWFPERVEGRDNHGAAAKAVCRQCEVRVPCLLAALEAGERHGIWCGAGGDLLRWLRRMWQNRDRDPEAWEQALDLHLRQLDGEPVVINRNGPGAVHGRPVTYNRGCRCEACCDSRRSSGSRTGAAEVAREAGLRGDVEGALMGVPRPRREGLNAVVQPCRSAAVERAEMARELREEGLTVDEIADALGVGVKTVRYNYLRPPEMPPEHVLVLLAHGVAPSTGQEVAEAVSAVTTLRGAEHVGWAS